MKSRRLICIHGWGGLKIGFYSYSWVFFTRYWFSKKNIEKWQFNESDISLSNQKPLILTEIKLKNWRKINNRVKFDHQRKVTYVFGVWRQMSDEFFFSR